MEGFKIQKLMSVAALLTLLPLSAGIDNPAVTSLVCTSQITLANHACLTIPRTRTSPRMLASQPVQSPDAASAPAQGDRRGHTHRRRQRTFRETQQQQECCHWLHEVDAACVCELLVRLPVFLSKPLHNYTVVVDEKCSVTFECGGRLVKA
ncbi:hypothetical protein Nepgr_032845 [Nepenthes gracilis]|uniref:Bifunctional inhibitor/plant lipid transfer protein/seed storage helical domain-containing protein n=1 Tax=Nepenthes gracilis TaxID=150966 RepID=A0AAD3Y635_NEPGR|nr:hypothetical protein Nepgr_032845 [Nepenthes gracilis]